VAEGASGAVNHITFREVVCEAALRVIIAESLLPWWHAWGCEGPGDLVRKRPENRRVVWCWSSPTDIKH